MPCRYKQHCHLHRLKWVKTTQPDTAACPAEGWTFSEGLGPAGWPEFSTRVLLTRQHMVVVHNVTLQGVFSPTVVVCAD